MAPGCVKLTIKASLTQIGLVGAFTRLLCAETGLQTLAATEVELAVVEAVTNVIKYGLPDLPDAEIELVCSMSESCLQIEICDQGIPIPAGVLEQADGSVFDFTVEDMDSWPTSGMGLSLIKAAMDSVRYDSVDGRNTLSLVKHMERPNEMAVHP